MNNLQHAIFMAFILGTETVRMNASTKIPNYYEIAKQLPSMDQQPIDTQYKAHFTDALLNGKRIWTNVGQYHEKGNTRALRLVCQLAHHKIYGTKRVISSAKFAHYENLLALRGKDSPAVFIDSLTCDLERSEAALYLSMGRTYEKISVYVLKPVPDVAHAFVLDEKYKEDFKLL